MVKVTLRSGLYQLFIAMSLRHKGDDDWQL
jgi:hypothetical protein